MLSAGPSGASLVQLRGWMLDAGSVHAYFRAPRARAPSRAAEHTPMNTRTLAVLLAATLAVSAASLTLEVRPARDSVSTAIVGQDASGAPAQSAPPAPPAGAIDIGPGPSLPDRFYPGYDPKRDKLPEP